MDKPAYYNDLFQQYLSGKINPEQKKELGEYLASQAATRNILSQLKNDYDSWESLPNHITQEQSVRIREALLKNTREANVLQIGRRRWLYYAAAAIILFIISSSIFMFSDNLREEKGPAIVTAAKDSIVPGGNKALLTRADGSVIELNDSTSLNIALQAGIIIQKLPDGQVIYKTFFDSAAISQSAPVYNTIQTPRGGECRLILPDGSQVWLNSASSISFPDHFDGKERKVIINGEAYFDVAHNKTMPFRVITGPQTLEVLGTHFSINAKADHSHIKTSLFEGSIRLTNGNDMKVLKPGQQSSLVAGKEGFTITNLSGTKTEPDWTEGYFSFDDADFITIQDQLEKWYDVAFVYETIPQNHFYGRIRRSSEIKDVLKMMEIVAKNIHFKIEGRKIYVLEEK